MKYAYQNLKDNARRRKKPFAISFEYFKQFCYETNYMAGKGRSRTSYTIDCIVNELGYVEGNIRVLPKHENSAKGTKSILEYDWQTRQARVNKIVPKEPEDFPDEVTVKIYTP